MEPVLVRRKEAAEALSVSLPTFDRLVREGRISSVRIGRAVLVPRIAVEQFAKGAAPAPEANSKQPG